MLCRRDMMTGISQTTPELYKPRTRKRWSRGRNDGSRERPAITTVALRASTDVGCISCSHQWMSTFGVVVWLCLPLQNVVLSVNVPLCAKATALRNSDTWVLESWESLELCDRCTAPVWVRCFPTSGAGAPPCLQTWQSQHTAKPASFLYSPRSWSESD